MADLKFDLDNKNKNFWVSEKGVSLFFLLNEIIRIRFDQNVEEEKKVGFKKKFWILTIIERARAKKLQKLA